jgi:DNA (cytosine-5)-methyltransferase 3A
VRLLKEIKPRYFILENVASMPQSAKDEISKALGVEPIMINAALVSAQNRKRLFWTNIPNVTQPEDRGILLKDILEENVEEKYNVSSKMMSFLSRPSGKTKQFQPMKPANINDKAATVNARCWKMGKQDNYIQRIGQIGKGGQADRIYSPEGKSVGLSALGGGRGAKTGLYLLGNKNPSGRGQSGNIYSTEGKSPVLMAGGGNPNRKRDIGYSSGNILDGSIIRKLTPIECERLQSLPDNYTEGISNSQRYKCLGNAFNKEVVKHILKNIK